MPLRVINSISTSLHAFDFDEEGWAQLKADYRSRGLRMPCCDADAIPKTSAKGTQFFAHARRGECTSAPESEEHLWYKQMIATAAQSVGWQVTTELRGQTPSGEDWIADVHCQKGTARVVFEVQASPQTDEELHHRQARYKVSGVRAAWFYAARLRRIPFTHDNDLPAFVLSRVEIGEVPHVLGFDILLPEFVAGMLTKRLNWTTERNEPIHVEVISDVCWACKKIVRNVFGHIEDMQIGEEPPDEWHERHFTVAQLSEALEEVQQVVSNDELKTAGLNTVMKINYIRGKPTNWPYCNCCIHCGRPQNNYHVGEKLRKAYYDPDMQSSLGLVPIDHMVKDAGRWVFRAIS
jgi:hypothetical protein